MRDGALYHNPMTFETSVHIETQLLRFIIFIIISHRMPWVACGGHLLRLHLLLIRCLKTTMRKRKIERKKKGCNSFQHGTQNKRSITLEWVGTLFVISLYGFYKYGMLHVYTCYMSCYIRPFLWCYITYFMGNNAFGYFSDTHGIMFLWLASIS